MKFPQLWDTLLLENIHLKSPAQYDAMIDFWVRNAGVLPLSLTIIAHHYEFRAASVINSFLPRFLPRIRNLFIVTPDLHSEINFLTRTTVNAPLLEVLHINIDSSPNWIRPISAFAIAPRLRKVYFRTPTKSSCCPQLPWAQLSRLELHNFMPLATVHTVLCDAQSLEYGRFLIESTPENEAYTLSPIHSTTLTSLHLTIRKFSVQMLNHLLKTLQLLALQKFYLAADVPVCLSSTTDVTLYALLSSAPLCILVLDNITLPINNLINVLSGLRTLERLGLYGSFDLRPICTWLMIHASLPNLIQLFLCTTAPEISISTRDSLDHFGDMVVSRCAGVGRVGLEEVHLYFEVPDERYMVAEELNRELDRMIYGVDYHSGEAIEIYGRCVSPGRLTRHSSETDSWYI